MSCFPGFGRTIRRVVTAAGLVVLVLGASQPASAVVKTYHHGIDGYTGVRDTLIRHVSWPGEPQALADIKFWP